MFGCLVGLLLRYVQLPLRHYFILYQAISQRGQIPEKLQPSPTVRTAGQSLTIIQMGRAPWHWKLPSTITKPDHPQYVIQSQTHYTNIYSAPDDNLGIIFQITPYNVCCDPSLEPSHQGGSNEGSQ